MSSSSGNAEGNIFQLQFTPWEFIEFLHMYVTRDDLSLVLPAWVYPTLDWMLPSFCGHIQHRWAKMGFLAVKHPCIHGSSYIHASTYM